MKKELEDKLIKEFPKIFQDTEKPPNQSNMAFGCECGDGWFGIIQFLCRMLQNSTDRENQPQIVASQIKEKFGELRFYVNSSSDKQNEMILYTETLSHYVCESCGTTNNVETLNINNWLSTRCKECLEK